MEITGLRRPMSGIPDKNSGGNGRVYIVNAAEEAAQDPLIASVLEEAAGVRFSQNLNAKSRVAAQRIQKLNVLLAETHQTDDELESLDQDLEKLSSTEDTTLEDKRQAFNQKAKQIYSQHARLLARPPFASGGPRPFLDEVTPGTIDVSRNALAKDREWLSQRRDKFIELSKNTVTIRDEGDDDPPPLREIDQAESYADSISISILTQSEEALSAQANIDHSQADRIL